MSIKAGTTGPYSLSNLDLMAGTVTELCTLYVVESADETMRPLQEDELRNGRFVDGARRMVFEDGRPALEHLVVTRTALRGSHGAHSAAADRELIGNCRREAVTTP